MGVQTATAIGLELVSTTLVNVAYVRERGAAAALPPLLLHRPRQSLRLLLSNRTWLGGFGLESGSFGIFWLDRPPNRDSSGVVTNPETGQRISEAKVD